KATRGSSTLMCMKYVLPGLACHNSIVSMPRLPGAGFLALALASFGCHQSGAECVPPPVVSCPAGGGPSFEAEVLPIFVHVCDNCHAPDAPMLERQMPYLTNYQQIYGTSGGSEARAINVQIFDNCSMPPTNAPVPLSDDE